MYRLCFFRNFILTNIFAFLFSTTFTQDPPKKDYFIHGFFNGADTGTIKMLSIDGDSVLNSSEIVGGHFIFQGQIESPQLLLFNISPYSWNFRAFVEKGNMEFKIDTAKAKHYGNRNIPSKGWALIFEIEQKGSELAETYKKYREECNLPEFISQINDWDNQLNNESLTKEDSNLIYKSIVSLNVVAENTQRTWIAEFIHANPESLAGPYIYYEYYNSHNKISIEDIEHTLRKFKAPATTSIYYQALLKLANDLKNLQPDSTAPDFTLLTPEKGYFTLSENKNQYILLDFWASWCAPCRKAIPDLKKIYEKYKERGFTIVGISNDRDWDDWTRALIKEKMPWWQVIDEFPGENQVAIVADLYKTNTLPHYVLVDKSGKIVLTTQNSEIMIEKIEEIFK